MANRTMEAKVRKIKRSRKKLPKSYSATYVRVRSSSDPQLIAACRNRSPSLAFDAKFLQFIEDQTRFKGVTPGRLAARKFALELMEKMPDPYVILLFNSGVVRIRMFFNKACDANHVFLVKEDFRKMEIMESITYGSTERAKEVFRSNKVTWKVHAASKLEHSDRPCSLP